MQNKILLLEKRIASIESSNATSPPTLLTTAQVADRANVIPLTVHNWKKRGLISGNKVGGKILYDEKEINKLLNK